MHFYLIPRKAGIILMVSIIFVIMTVHIKDVQAQSYTSSQNWSTWGNNIVTGDRLGTRNAMPLSIVANNIEMININPSGLITFGPSPIVAPSFLQFGISCSMKFPKNQYIFRHSDSQEGLYSNFANQKIEYRDPAGVPNMWMDWSSSGNSYFRGNMGIGTGLPENKLHVFRGSAGTVTANADALLVVENSTNNYINLLSPSTHETGILFGDNLNPQDGGILYASNNDMQFRTNGNYTRMVLSGTGNLGIGTLNATPYKVKVSHDSYGLNLENASTKSNWELITHSNGNLLLYYNDNFRGSFNYTNGAYSSLSDERLKTDIQSIPSVITKIKQLKPSTYWFKTSNRQEVGFVAQDVMKVFPSLVTYNSDKARGLDAYTLDYSGLITIAIKGIQELDQTVEEQKEIIKDLQNRLNKLEALTGSNSLNVFPKETSMNVVVSSNTMLGQNNPNPVRTTTSIRYHIPKNAKNIQLTLTDNSGKIIKKISLQEGIGVVNIDTSTLENGTYIYSLFIDGKLTKSRKMVVIH